MNELVVVDADVLGRERTGDETYVRNLLRELPAAAQEAGLRVAAVTRHPELVPEGVEGMVLRLRRIHQPVKLSGFREGCYQFGLSSS